MSTTRPLASDTAMVLAAGLGKRMRPLTATRPKPMVKVAGKPLIDHALDRVAEAGLAHAVVNVHYLPDALEAHVLARKAPRVQVSDERAALLETGGGMVKAQPQLPDPFFAINSDALWLDGPRSVFHELSLAWRPAEMDALLLVVGHRGAHNYKGRGDFTLDPLGRLQRRRADRSAPFVFTGIQLVAHRLLRDPPDAAFSTGLLWDRAIAEQRLFGLVHTGEWFELGTPESIAPTEEWLRRV
ncbi:MAG: nucleotidyltransferase family protein [Sphingomonadales bacterium]|nr:nucleotidyltransferase family protein [Sphingomonadales bacterium]